MTTIPLAVPHASVAAAPPAGGAPITDLIYASLVPALLTAVCGCFALIGFPLDDVWHRLFGQDVTLWGPTHLLMIGGASLATLGVWALQIEGRRSSQPDANRAGVTRGAFWRRQADTLSA